MEQEARKIFTPVQEPTPVEPVAEQRSARWTPACADAQRAERRPRHAHRR
jgi:hypothetical protein